MDVTEAKRTLVTIDRVRHGTRRAMNPIWFSNVVVGAFFLGAALLAAADAASPVMLAYWVAGWAVALAVIVRHYMRIERALGVESRAWDAPGAIVLTMIGGIVAANVLTDSAAAPLHVAAAGTVALGVLLHDRIEVAAGAAIAAVASALLLADPERPGGWAALGLAVVLVLAGLAGRARDRA